MKKKSRFLLATTMALMLFSISSLALANNLETEDAIPQTKTDRLELHQEMHEQMEELLEEGNYQDWLDFIEENHPNAEVSITEEQFEAMIEAHGLMEEARQILEEAGIERGFGHGFKPHFGMRGHMMKWNR